MMFAMKVWVYITGNTLSQSGSDIVNTNDVIVSIAFLSICVLVFAVMLVSFIRRVNRIMVGTVVINDLF